MVLTGVCSDGFELLAASASEVDLVVVVGVGCLQV